MKQNICEARILLFATIVVAYAGASCYDSSPLLSDLRYININSNLFTH